MKIFWLYAAFDQTFLHVVGIVERIDLDLVLYPFWVYEVFVGRQRGKIGKTRWLKVFHRSAVYERCAGHAF